MNKPVAIVLGGTVPHVSLVQKLKSRGYYVILADYTKNPPAKELADEHVFVSTLDIAAVLRLAKERLASLIISTSIDQSNATCCYVAEKLNLPHPYSYETALNVTNKGLMKKIFVECEIPTSSFVVVCSTEDYALKYVRFPAVVKPVDCNSSKGVVRVDSKQEMLAAVKNALELSRTNSAIVEGFNVGFEIQVDCLAYENGADVLLTRQKRHIKDETNMVLQSIGSIVPAQLSEKLMTQAHEIADKIMKGFGLRNTPFFYQAIVTNEGVQVLEFAPRSGGGLSSYMLEKFVGYDVVEAGICSFLNTPIPRKSKSIDKSYLTTLLYMNAGVFDKVVGLERLKDEDVILDYFVYRHSGAILDDDMRSSNRIASFVIAGNDEEEAMQKYQRAISVIDILNPEGISVLRKELY